MIRNSVPQLPIGQDHALIRCQFHGRIRLQKGTPAQRACGAAGAGRWSSLTLGEQDREKGKVVVQDKPGRQAMTFCQRVTQSAVGLPEPLGLLRRKILQRRTNITKHPAGRSEQPDDAEGQSSLPAQKAVIAHSDQNTGHKAQHSDENGKPGAGGKHGRDHVACQEQHHRD